jgi:hypothetical protein
MEFFHFDPSQRNLISSNLRLYSDRLQHLFIGHSVATLSAVRQMKLRALALQFIYTVRGSNASALAQCEHLLAEIEDVQK